ASTMQFRCGNAVTRCHISHQSLLAIECCYLHSRIMKELADKLSGSQRLTNRRLRRIACFCAAALCLSAAAAQDSEDVREKTHQIEELRSAGKFQEAVPIAEQVLKYCEKNYGPEHSETADSLNDLAFLYSSMGEQAKALPLYQRALKIREKAFGAEHPHTANIQNNLGAIYLSQGDLVKAESLFKQALETREKIFGPNNPATGESINNLAWVYMDGGDYSKAEPFFQRSLKIT